MGLRVLPANPLLALEDCIAVVKKLTIREVEIFKDTEL
jgi:hypothetical protein